jgi:F0F1-type ATP synthase assembly protein I
MDVNKSYSKKSFLKLRTIIGIKLRNSVVSLVIFNYNSFNSCFSDKLGNLTVALGVAGAGIALHFKSNRFAGWLYHVWRFYNTEIAFNLAELRAM